MKIGVWGRALAAIALAFCSFTTISIAVPRHAIASQGTEGCNPQRSDDSSSNPLYFDGWMVNPTTTGNTSLGGVSMAAVAYSPYVVTGTSGTDKAVAAWGMLDDATATNQTTNDYAQTGWLEWPGNSPPTYTREYFMEIDGPGGYSHFNYWNNTSPWQPDISTSHSYTTLWNPTSTVFSFQVDGYTWFTYSGAGWTPVQAFISGETHNSAEQMEGDVNVPVDFTSAGWVYGGSSTWHTFNYLSDAAFYYWMHYAGSTTLNPIGYMAGNVISANEIKIWDWACPPNESVFQGGNGYLYTSTTAGAVDTNQGMLSGTSPSIAHLPGGGDIVAFQNNSGNLSVLGKVNTSLGMKSGTSPSIAASSSTNWEVAVEANTGYLWTYNQSGTGTNTGLGMASGTSPSIVALSGGGYEIAFQANTGAMFTTGSAGGVNTGLGMASGTSPSITQITNGSYVAAMQANTGNLYTYSSSSGGSNTGQGMKSSTNPSIVGLSTGGFEIAFQANTGVLVTNGSSGINTGLAMASSTSPNIAAFSGGAFIVSFQSGTNYLSLYSSQGGVDTTSGAMLSGTSPGIAGS